MKAHPLLFLGIAPSTDKSSKAFSVLSQSGDSPNFVKVYNNAKVTCNCRNYKPKKICAHAISVAESLGILSEFVAWYRKQKVPTNLTSVATLDTNVKASGRAHLRRSHQHFLVLIHQSVFLRDRDYQKFLFPSMNRYHQSLIPRVIRCLQSLFLRIIHCCQSLIPRVIHRCQSLIPRVIHRCQSLSTQVIRCHQSRESARCCSSGSGITTEANNSKHAVPLLSNKAKRKHHTLQWMHELFSKRPAKKHS